MNSGGVFKGRKGQSASPKLCKHRLIRRGTRHRETFSDAWKALKSVFGRGSAPDPSGRAQDRRYPDPLVGWGGESPFLPYQFSLPQRNISNDNFNREKGHSPFPRPGARLQSVINPNYCLSRPYRSTSQIAIAEF